MHADVSCIKSRTLPSSLDEERERDGEKGVESYFQVRLAYLLLR